MSDFNRSFGIILGSDTYQNGVPKLSTEAADAEMLNQILKGRRMAMMDPRGYLLPQDAQSLQVG